MSTSIPLPSELGRDLEEAKEALRAVVREHRRARPDRDRARVAEALAEHGVQAVGEARCVAAYVAHGSEPQTIPLLEALRTRGIRVLLPVLGPGLARCWGEFTSADDLAERAPRRPPEPSGEVLGPEALEAAEVIFAPALAMDADGIRLGQGAGWYDRALLHRRPGATIFGVVHEAELIADRCLPRAPHDIPVDAVITEDRWFLLEGSPFRAEALSAALGG